MSNTLKALWSRDAKEVNVATLALSERSVEASARQQLITDETAVIAAERAVETAKMEAKDSGQFGPIAKAVLAHRTSVKVLENSQGVYAELFGAQKTSA
jgi:uncharacterized cupredoxin-like copper-binding protein